MKNILLIIALLVCSTAQAQIKPSYPIILKAGSNGYVTIAGQDFNRDAIGFFYNYTDSFATNSGTYDSTISIYWLRDGLSLYSNVLDTMFVYGDSTNKQVRNMGVLRTWFINNAYYRGN